MRTDLAYWTLEFYAQAGGAPRSSLDDLSTPELILRTVGFLAVLIVAGWFARRLRR